MTKIQITRDNLQEDFIIPVQIIDTHFCVPVCTFKKLEYQVNLIAKKLKLFSLTAILNIKPSLSYTKVHSKICYSVELVELLTFDGINILEKHIKL